MPTRPLVAAAVLLVLATSPARAQIDYHNLDDDRPTRVTDAFPIERYSFELSLPYRLGLVDGRSAHSLTPHLEYGIARNLMVGVGLDLDLGGGSGEPTQGGVSLLFNPLRETTSFPGIGFAVEASGTGFDHPNVSVGLLATRSFGRSRLHLNLFGTPISPDDLSAATEPRWWAGAAWDVTLIRTSTLLVVALDVADPAGDGEASWEVGAGIRKQITPTLVAHAGLARGLDGPEPATRINIGLSHAFAVRALMRRGPR